MAAIRPISASTKGNAAHRELRSRILDGSIEPGIELSQSALATALGVSVTPLREALRRLEGEGLVSIGVHKSVTVVPLSQRELDELRVVRLQLEPLACSLAARSEPREQSGMLIALAASIPPMDADAWHDAHRRFHHAIYDLAGNQVLAGLLDYVWLHMHRYRFGAWRQGVFNQVPDNDHAEIATAIVGGNLEAAARSMVAHLTPTSRIGPVWKCLW
ncbi:MAG: GntR family transcriptional regulator [Candidatus Dormiibacterota bacterium]